MQLKDQAIYKIVEWIYILSSEIRSKGGQSGLIIIDKNQLFIYYTHLRRIKDVICDKTIVIYRTYVSCTRPLDVS